MTSRRPGPADWGGRIDRVEQIEASNATAEPLALLSEVLRYQRRRAEEPEVASAVAAVSHEVLARRLVGDWPLLDVGRCADTISVSVGDVVGSLDRPDAPVPAPLRDAGRELSRMTMEERADAVEMWLDDPGLVHPQFAFWLRAATAPVLETAAAKVEPPS
ncbi:MAG: hypothetical protein H0U16_02175, partial [Actinobacteria bacterium]|nr:hypothetical protein [Actinomycetota bacterium]